MWPHSDSDIVFGPMIVKVIPFSLICSLVIPPPLLFSVTLIDTDYIPLPSSRNTVFALIAPHTVFLSLPLKRLLVPIIPHDALRISCVSYVLIHGEL